MFGLAQRLVAGMVTPLVDQLSASSARLLRKLALLAVAGLSLIVVVIALTIAFDLWIASMAGAIVGALAVAGLYAVVAGIALFLALRPSRPRAPSQRKAAAGDEREAAAAGGINAQIDAFAAPLLALLQRFGLRREQLAVLAGTSVAKQLGPIPLVGLAIVAGFLIGRMWGGWRGLLSSDLVATLLGSDLLGALFRSAQQRSSEPGDDEAPG